MDCLTVGYIEVGRWIGGKKIQMQADRSEGRQAGGLTFDQMIG